MPLRNCLHEFETEQKREIPTRFIGAKVMEKLHAIDPDCLCAATPRFIGSSRKSAISIEEIQTYQEKRSIALFGAT